MELNRRAIRRWLLLILGGVLVMVLGLCLMVRR